MASTDPVTRLARLAIIKMSAELEVQIATRQGSAPTLEILRRLRARAAESLAAMVFLNLDDPKDIIKLRVMQNEVKRYDEWLGWMVEITAEGKVYDQLISDEDRQELLDALSQTPEGQQEAVDLGLVNDGVLNDAA